MILIKKLTIQFDNQLLYEIATRLFKVNPSLSTSIGALTLERPTILASGILGISLDIFERLYRAGAGAVVTKSLSKEPWDGYANPTIFGVKGGGWINAVGLSNPGATNFSKMISSNSEVPIIAACDAGADGITAINTIRAMAIDVETQKPILSNKIGGLSGTPIKPIAIRCVYEISSKFDIPIIGCGGISTWEDAVEFILAGASAVQFGSVLGEQWIEVFADINSGIQNYMKQKGYSNIGEMIGNAKES